MARRRVPKAAKSKDGTIMKELLVGVLAIGLGGYNLAGTFGLLNVNIEIPQIVANVLLVLAGLFLLGTALKLNRIKYHSKHLF